MAGSTVKNKMRMQGGSIEGLSVVIPALNAEAGLGGTLAALAGGPAEVVLVDGGSTDGTGGGGGGRRRARGAGAAWAGRPAGGGRGGGARARGCCSCMPTRASARAGRRRCGAWSLPRMARRAPGISASRSTMADRRRGGWNARWPGAAACWKLPYGDQGLLIHRGLLEEAGGMRPLPLMEDVDVVRRLGRRRIGALDVPAVTSAARWRRDGYLRRSSRNLLCLALWFASVSPRIIARIYAGRRG
jgi:hypothetical protein